MRSQGKRRGLAIGLCFPMFLCVKDVAAQVTAGGDGAGMFVFDMETFSDLAGPTGNAAVFLADEGLGITFAEKLLGQVNNPVDGFDVISGSPGFPLTIDTTVRPEFGVNALSIFGSTVIDGLGSVGFPAPSAIGDGSLTVLFAVDQSLIAFDLVGTNGGSLEVLFYSRSGEQLAAKTVTNVQDTSYVFSSDLADIAAMTLNNNDWGGLAFDNFVFQPGQPVGVPVCNAGGPYFVDVQQGLTAVALSASLPGQPQGVWEFQWVSDCPGATFDDQTSMVTTMHVESPACFAECSVSLLARDGTALDICSATVAIGTPSGAAIVTCPPDRQVECDGAGNLDALTMWLDAASGANQVPANDFTGLLATCGQAGGATVAWWVDAAGTGGCAQQSECAASFEIVDTRAPEVNGDVSSVVIEDTDCDGQEFVEFSGLSAWDECSGSVELVIDAPNSFWAGESVTVALTTVDGCGNETAVGVDVTVLHASGVDVQVLQRTDDHERGSPSSPLSGVRVEAFLMSHGSCAREYRDEGEHHERQARYQDIVMNCEPDGHATTDAEGWASVGLLPGEYLLIAEIDENGDGQVDHYVAHETEKVKCGKWKQRRLVHEVHDDDDDAMDPDHDADSDDDED